MTKPKKTFLTPLRVAGLSVLLVVIACLGTWLYLHDKNVAILNPKGIIASQQVDLMAFTLILSVIVVVPVFTMLGVIAWKYREGNPKATYEPDHEGSKWLEVAWWGIPIVIIAILSVVTWISTHELDPYKPIASDKKAVKVQVVALQWKWLFLYPEYGVASVNELKMPVGVPVNFEITADSPMRAFGIPNLGSQTYAMNGMSSKLSLRADKEGSYRGSNTNISGEGYADMHFQAVALKDQAAFDAWVADVKQDDASAYLDQDTYDELRKPSKKTPVTQYDGYASGLYDTIMHKYMPMDHAHKEGH